MLTIFLQKNIWTQSILIFLLLLTILVMIRTSGHGDEGDAGVENDYVSAEADEGCGASMLQTPGSR